MKRTVLTVVLALGLGVFAALPASAANESREAEITYRCIKIVLDGREICPRDAAGNEVEPFILDGTTYLPVRAVADALGLEVRWRSSDSTVLLRDTEDDFWWRTLRGDLANPPEPSAPPQSAQGHNGTVKAAITYRGIRLLVDGVVIEPKDAAGNTVEPFILNGTTYLPVRAVADALGLAVDWDAATGTVRLSHWLVLRRHEEQTDKRGELDYWSTNEYKYNAFGRMVYHLCSSDLGDDETRLSYDGDGRLVRREDAVREPDGSTVNNVTSYIYDSESGLCVSADSAAEWSGEPYTVKIAYEYDGAGRLVRTVRSTDGEVDFVYEWAYDGAGRIAMLRETYVGGHGAKSGFTEQYSYDGNGRLVLKDHETYGAEYSYGWQEYFSYDADGREVVYGTRGSSDGDTEERSAYDGTGRLIRKEWVTVAHEDGGDEELLELTEYFYDELGRLVRERSSDEWSSISETVYTYDANGNVLRCEEKLGQGVQTTVREYEYVKAGG